MEMVLFRAMCRAAEQRLAEKLRAKAEPQPSRIASEVIAEFRRIIQFEPFAESLQVRIHAHIEKVLGRHGRKTAGRGGTSENR